MPTPKFFFVCPYLDYLFSVPFFLINIKLGVCEKPWRRQINNKKKNLEGYVNFFK